MSPALRRWLPFLAWPRPTRATLAADLRAGLAVGLVLIPQALAYATLAGMPAQTGLYAALLPAVVGCLWGSSPLLAAGPVALTSLLSFGALQPFAAPGSSGWVAAAVWLALYAGLMQCALGALRLGVIANLVSGPTLAGFIHAAALIIIATQLPALLGLPPWGASLSGWPAQVAARLQQAPGAVAVSAAFGLGALLLLLWLRRHRPRWPGVLLVCGLGIVISHFSAYAGHGGAVIGSVPEALPQLSLPPALDFGTHRALLAPALVVALVSFTEAMSSARTLARRRGERWNENQELIGQGLAKIASAASGAFPVSGSFSRSALNEYAGARTAWSTLFAAACVFAFLLAGTAVLAPLPQAVLAAVVIVPVTGLLNVAGLRRIGRLARDDGLVALITFAATLFAVPQLHWGVLAGLIAGLAASMLRRSQPRIVELGVLPDGRLRARERYGLPRPAPDLIVLRPDTALVYASAAAVERAVLDHVDAGVQRVLLVGTAINDLDVTGLDTLRELRRTLAARGTTLYLCRMKLPVWRLLERAGVPAEFGESRCFRTERQAIAALTGENPAPAAADRPHP